MSVLASAVRPLMATPMCVSTSAIFSMLDGSCEPGTKALQSRYKSGKQVHRD